MNIVASTVVFTVDDLASSRHFFTTHLGFREVLDTPDFTWLSRDDAAADILLHQRDLEQPRERIAHTGDYYPEFVPGIVWSGQEWVDNRFHTYRPEELVRLALSKPARFEPGTAWSYSNTNYVLARLLIEKVTGRSYAEEMQRLILGPLGLSGTVAPSTQPEIPEPHAHAYYRYEEAGEQKTVDVTRQNPSWISSGGDMISTTQDLHTFISALVGGKLLPAPLLAEMCAPHPTGIPNMDYGLGVFVVNTDGGGTVISHNGGIAGHGALMYSTPDGSTTLTAALNYVDDVPMSLAGAFQAATQRLVKEVFRGGQAGSADAAEPAQ